MTSMISLRQSFTEHYPAVPAAVVQARTAVAALAGSVGATPERQEGIRLAVSEAVSNAVVHGYGGREGEIELTVITIVPGELRVVVSDRGCGFQTPAENPGLGWGLPLIAHASDDFVIAERPDGGTEVRMRFKLAATDDG